MTKYEQMTDAAALDKLGERLAGHRLELNLTQAALAKQAGISKRTLVRLEGGESTQLTNLVRVLRALGLLGNLDSLVPPPLPSPLEQLRAHGRRRKRASPQTKESEPSAETDWKWGDPEGDR